MVWLRGLHDICILVLGYYDGSNIGKFFVKVYFIPWKKPKLILSKENVGIQPENNGHANTWSVLIFVEKQPFNSDLFGQIKQLLYRKLSRYFFVLTNQDRKITVKLLWRTGIMTLIFPEISTLAKK